MSPDKTWKAVERAVCRYFNSERTGPVGKEGPDCDHKQLAIQVKHRENLPAWLLSMVGQTEEQAGGRFPVLVLHPYGAAVEDSMVILTLDRARELMVRYLNANSGSGAAEHLPVPKIHGGK